MNFQKQRKRTQGLQANFHSCLQVAEKCFHEYASYQKRIHFFFIFQPREIFSWPNSRENQFNYGWSELFTADRLTASTVMAAFLSGKKTHFLAVDSDSGLPWLFSKIRKHICKKKFPFFGSFAWLCNSHRVERSSFRFLASPVCST